MGKADLLPCCPVCSGPDRPAKVEASGACCCFHMPNPNFVPSAEQLREAEERLSSRRAEE